jgi:hypothetical protein
MIPPIGFDTPPDLPAARQRNHSNIIITPTQDIDVYRVLDIHSSKDMQAAFITWDVDQLLKYDRPVRTSLARALIDMALRYQRQPMEVWVKCVEDPDFFDRWRDERATVVLDDLTNSPDNLADGEPLPRAEDAAPLPNAAPALPAATPSTFALPPTK